MSAGTLRDFFNMQSKTGLNLDRKAQIFANIQGQIKPATRQTTSFSMMRSSWYFKTATTAALAFTLIYVLYTPITGPLFQMKDNILIARQGNVAQAGYVGDILATQGEINIVRNGVSTKTSKLQGGDTIYLYNTSKADFTLRDGSHGVVEGPAQLTIVEHADVGLVLSVDHARYMQIDKAQDNTADTTKEQLTIQTPTSRITTEQDDKVHLALVTTQDRQFIQNKGDSVTIESIVPNTASPITQQLASSTVADVTDSVKVYKEVAMIYDELKTQSTSQTYDLTSGELATDDIKSLLALQNPIANEDKFDHNSKPHYGQTQLAYQDLKSSAVTSQWNNEGANDDANDPEIATPTTIMALMTSDGTDISRTPQTMSQVTSSTRLNTDSSEFNHQDAKIVNTLLVSSTEDHSGGEANKEVKESHDPILTTSDKILNSQQLMLLSNLSHKSCISQDHLEKLQSGFGITSGSSIETLIATIKSSYYLTADLSNTISSISVCHDDEN